MKESIQNKINKIQEIALASASKKDIEGIEHAVETNNNNNLIKSIRNEKESELFFSELNLVIDQAKRNSIKNTLK